MALVLADRVKVRARTTGTGTFTLESTAEGYQGFEAVGTGNETYYGIVDALGNWEIGRGTYTASGTRLSRDTVVSSSNNDALVNFPAGGKNVFGTFPSSIALALISGGGLDLSAVGQNILPAIDSNGTTGYTLGSAAFKWKELFVSNGSIYIGDVKLSNVGGKLSVVKVINPGEDDEEEDSEDSEADSEIKAVNKLVNDEHEFVLESDGTLTLDGDPFTGGGGSGDLGDLIINDSNIYSDTSGNFVNLDAGGAGWMRLGTLNNEKLQLIVNYDEGGDAKVWEFDEGGELRLPTGGAIWTNYGYIDQDTDVQGNALRVSGGNSVVINTAEDEYSWLFDNSGNLTLPEGGNILDSNGDSVLGGGSTSYTPDDVRDWEDPAPTTISAALDELAARVAALQNFEIDGGNAYTPSLGELLIDGNGA